MPTKSKKSTGKKQRPVPERAGSAKVRSRQPPPKPTSKGGRAMTDKKQADADGAGDRNVDQIRDILFGGQMRDYERRFVELAQKLEQEATRLRAEMEKRVAALEKRFDDASEKLARSVRQEISDRGKACDDLIGKRHMGLRAPRLRVRSD